MKDPDVLSAPPLISLREIEVRYGSPGGPTEVRVLSGISLDLRPGEILAVAGRSGAGKTTLLHVAAGLATPTSGDVLWFGRSLSSLSERERADARRRSFGVVLQTGGLIDWLRADENVALAELPDGWSNTGRERGREVLLELGLDGQHSRFPAELSGGEQQRVALARAIYSDPAILILDEPTAHLDRPTADQIIDAICRLRTPTRGIVAATHDPALIDQADRVIHLD